MNKFLLGGFLILNIYALLIEAFVINRPPKFDWTDEEKQIGQKQVGDIIYYWDTYSQAMNMTAKSFRLLGRDMYKWPGGNIPFQIDTNQLNAFQVQKIKRDHQLLSTYTRGCLKFYEARTWDISYISYVKTHNNQGASAGVSRLVFKNLIFNLVIKIQKKFKTRRPIGSTTVDLGGLANSLPVALHETMHALGIAHESNRADRDEHIKIDWSKIPAEHRSAYAKDSWGSYYNTPYDTQTLMHSSSDGITALRPPRIDHSRQEFLPEDQILTAIDKQGIRNMYNC